MTSCNVHDDIFESFRKEINTNICELVKARVSALHSDGKPYCILHWPARSKDVNEFRQALDQILSVINSKIIEFEKDANSRSTNTEEVPVDFSKVCFDFRYIHFPMRPDFKLFRFMGTCRFDHCRFHSGADFSSSLFSQAADFRSATFSGQVDLRSTIFLEFADFTSVLFEKDADFSSATFCKGVRFRSAVLKGLSRFRDTKFLGNVDFSYANLLEESQTHFRKSGFCDFVDFRWSTLSGRILFEAVERKSVFLNSDNVAEMERDVEWHIQGKNVWGHRRFVWSGFGRKKNLNGGTISLDEALIENPERTIFRAVVMDPRWFIGIDISQITFDNVVWSQVEHNDERLEITYKQLSYNSEEKGHYEQASGFRYSAMEVKRQSYPLNGFFVTLLWWYKISSGYGESWRRAFGTLLFILLMFGLLYNSPWATFDRPPGDPMSDPTRTLENVYKMNNGEGIVYSLNVAAFQRPEPKPTDTRTKLLIILETIIAPVQAALLALAIRRKFMR